MKPMPTCEKNSIDADAIGFSTNIFSEQKDAVVILRKIASAFKFIEIELEHVFKSQLTASAQEKNSLMDQLLKIKAEQALSFSVHGPYIGSSTDIASRHVAIRQHAVKLMKKSLSIAHSLGAKVFTCHPGYIDQSFDNHLIAYLQHSLDELVPYADQLGITLSLENTGSHRPKYIVLDYAQHQQLCVDYGIGLTLDLIHYTTFNPLNPDYYEGLRTLIPCIKNVHFADMKIPYHAHLPLGEGDFDYQAILQFLYAQGYQGKAIIEETAKLYTAEHYLSKAHAYQQTLLDSARKRSAL